MTLVATSPDKTGSKLARFRRVAESLKLPDEYQATWGDNLYTLLQKYGPLIPWRVARKFARLSNDELVAACNEFRRFLPPEKPSPLLHRVAYHLTVGLEAVYHASIIALVLPTYSKLASTDQPIDREFVIVSTYDFDHTSPLVFLPGRFPAKRINMLHGAMMQQFTPDQKSIFEEDVEWFGENRDTILPIWDHVVSDGSFTRARVQALMSGAENGAPTLIEGAL